ncbi:FAD-dependent oxidoreductase [Micromonospora purpureochromogenes]|uniref:Thioredoxin reductase/SAM-dependent methyltransferase n=1 Tax=Micromonospora purpureochromogenes TaxID=47872 RepID=A0ABX2RGT6_9ACTN|nr:FAD-dependent oxidoreductase [Micromonospora purpureochromogenes]NYF54418.1 thioredoxin reductase/SAM-dependent methyltransferase [Micromonospora purpureochromogenes]
MREHRIYDVVVVGGGAAGLSGALTLGRSRRSVLVIDGGAPRNAPAGHVHNYLTSEGVAPAELYATGRAEVAGYGVEVVDGTVTKAHRVEGLHDRARFEVELADGELVRARRLLVTTGLVDELPAIPGLAERWGRDVLHCPYCHGWEVRDQAVGVLATGPMTTHHALLFRQLTDDVVVFAHTGPPLAPEQAEQLAARGVRVVEGEVTGLEVTDDRLTGVRLRSGELVARQALVVGPRFAARADLLAGLGLTTSEFVVGGHVFGDHVAADASGATAVPGVWVAGNVTDPQATVIAAAAAGVRAGAALNADLIAEETDRAVTALRADADSEAETGADAVAGTGADAVDAETARHWDELYQRRERIWSGRANPHLVDVVDPLPAGTALDLGCGEGADAIWLAGRGWRVTAVDVSTTALDRAAAEAATAGVAARIDFQRHDLTRTFPEGVFDLVSAQFLQSPLEFPRAEVLRAAARAVAPGGRLLIVEHGEVPPWSRLAHPHVRFLTPEETLAELDLDPDGWRTERLDAPRREVTDPDGRPATLVDHLVLVRRR